MTRIDTAAFLRRVTFPVRPAGEAGELFAAAWPVTPWRLAVALAAAGVDVDEDQALEVYERLDEALAERRARQVGVDDPAVSSTVEALMSVEPTEAGLLLDERLEGRLPLLGLATDMARREPSGRLRVELVAGDGMGPADGWFSRCQRAGVILLEESLLDEPDELARVWAHELAHGLDPHLAGVTAGGLEAFAYALGPLLLEHAPASVAEAAFLVARALEDTGRRRRTVPTGSSLAELLEWALAEAGVLVPAPTLIAAHLVRVGVNGKPAEEERLSRPAPKVASASSIPRTDPPAPVPGPPVIPTASTQEKRP